MPDTDISTLSETVRGLLQAVGEIDRDAPNKQFLNGIVERGGFRPAEDEAIGFWFARFLSVRESLWTVVEDILAVLYNPANALGREQELRFFLLGYGAACLLIRIDRIVLFDVAHHSLIQRKLNEAFPEYRIPRKQYTKIFRAFVDDQNVFAMREAMSFRKKNADALQALADDPDVGFIAQQIDELESCIDTSKRAYIRRALRYISHKWRRRGVVSAHNILAKVAEGVGRTASEFVERKNKRVTPDVLESIGNFLQPGDVIVTRHAKALTNLFLPGFWPHAALYVGESERHDAGLCVLEALKDGVRLRPLEETLAVDAFVVLRPNFEAELVSKAIDRAFMHEGKMYNFDFDFFNSDRVVCTELVYRSYDGLADLNIPLNERAGRQVLSAEDLLDFALSSNAFTPVAIFGTQGCDTAVLYDDRVRDILVKSYRDSAGD
ncbi:MAG: hypothetical protein KJO82_11725 [Gammaproteobacteria bacterium]|nr:hypothetical protein [Gammaproteobacteria bacterium]